MLHNKQRTESNDEIEIYVTDDGQRILIYPSLTELLSLLNEFGQCEFGFTPYCG